jgi:hypothetical protein
MIGNISSVRKQLSELATVLNEFKSEAVQLRILDLVFGAKPVDDAPDRQEDNKTARRGRATRTPRAKKVESIGAGRRKKAHAGTGANSTLGQLLSGNFFDKARTINDIIEHCKHNLARTFKANEFSGKLGRMVRGGELARKKNAEKQYEYKKP